MLPPTSHNIHLIDQSIHHRQPSSQPSRHTQRLAIPKSPYSQRDQPERQISCSKETHERCGELTRGGISWDGVAEHGEPAEGVNEEELEADEGWEGAEGEGAGGEVGVGGEGHVGGMLELRGRGEAALDNRLLGAPRCVPLTDGSIDS